IQVDDPVGAIAVHGICGAFGTAAVGIFALEEGLLYGGGLAQLGIQLLGIVGVFIWTFPLAFILFKAIDAVIGLRVSRHDELEGLDSSEHDTVSYPDFVPSTSNSERRSV
ncbi:MAG: ammonium transporter, partial [Bacillota bacterium]